MGIPAPEHHLLIISSFTGLYYRGNVDPAFVDMLWTLITIDTSAVCFLKGCIKRNENRAWLNGPGFTDWCGDESVYPLSVFLINW